MSANAKADIARIHRNVCLCRVVGISDAPQFILQ